MLIDDDGIVGLFAYVHFVDEAIVAHEGALLVMVVSYGLGVVDQGFFKVFEVIGVKHIDNSFF